jgi:predicted  nucleic acid-binding Zn-ribbon protein
MGKKLNIEAVIERARSIHGDLYSYEKSIYIGFHNHIEIVCEAHNKSFWQTPSDHISKKAGCPDCGKEKSHKNRRLTLQEFIERANIIHNFKYGYLKVELEKSSDIIEIDCPIHGSWFQNANSHLLGNGCRKCGTERIKSQISSTFEEFKQKALLIHKEYYTYPEQNYKNNKTLLEINCPIHGLFLQTANQHLGGQGCRACGYLKSAEKLTSNKDVFIIKANIIHNDIYVYDLFDYISAKTPGIITCKIHGDFLLSANRHLLGQGCKKCSKRYFKKENDWLDSLNVKKGKEYRQRYIKISGRRIYADGFDLDTNTIYEFNGDFWHGNPNKYKSSDINYRSKKSYGYLYDCMLEREKLIAKAGYKLVSIWESDWDKLANETS